jgi:O-antigen/teichoic acid export membrane protein
MAMGRADYLSKTNLINLALLAVFIFPVIQSFGLPGVAVLVVLIYVQHAVLFFWLLSRQASVHARDLWGALRVPVLATIVMALTVVLVKTMVHLPLVILLIAEIGAGAFVYAAIVFLLDPDYLKFLYAQLRRGQTPPESVAPELPRT